MAEQFNYLDYPIGEHLENICSSLKNSSNHCLILTAETAAGKSTVLPYGLLQAFEGKILISEPRRLAVLGVANRIAEELNEEVGNTVGYKIHLENKISSKTRLEVVTEGILVRNLQKDPALEQYQVVVIDEFHERSINTDLALAFLKEAMELRDDLYVIIMSATIDARPLLKYFGDRPPFLSIPGRTFEVKTLYDDKSSVVDAVMREAPLTTGNTLVFLPALYDIKKCHQQLLEEFSPQEMEKYEIHILHSSVSLDQQKKAISPVKNGIKKIILSSAIAETSLTVPGVTLVIDSGLARVNRMNLATGMENLVTEIESEFSAEQRKGRAGRLENGKCIRLWSEFDPRKKTFEPEILRTDLSQLVLECAERGVYSYDSIDWLDSPQKSAWKTSCELLMLLGLQKENGHITEKGRLALKLGLSPRLASIAIDGKVNNLNYESLVLKYSSYFQSSPEIKNRFIQDLNKRLQGINIETIKPDCSQIKDSELLILSGFPDRLAKRITSPADEKQEYQFYSGRKAIIVNDKHENALWICAPEVLDGSTEGRIYDYEILPTEIIKTWLKNKIKVQGNSFFENGKVQKREDLCFGKIVIESKRINATQEDYKLAWINLVKEKGFDVLPISEKCKKFLQRVKFYRQQNQLNSEGSSLENELVENAEEWLLPFINSANLDESAVFDALYWYLNGSAVEEEVPELLKIPNGSKVKVRYELQNSPDEKNKLIIRPVIEVIIQRMFGVYETPKICGMKALLKLLSPASRPLQITDDLGGFWNGAWIEICKEMKGRYPKHNWDYKQFEE